MFNIFQHPWTLLIAAVIVLLVMLILRSILPEKRRWWQLALPLFLVLAAFGLDQLVQTDLEKINSVIATAVEAFEEENADVIEAIISEDYYDSYHNTKKELIYYCRMLLSEPLVAKNVKRIVQIEIEGPKATAVFTVRTLFDERSYVYDLKRLMFTKMELSLQKQRSNQWLINRTEVLEIDKQLVNWKDIKQAAAW